MCKKSVESATRDTFDLSVLFSKQLTDTSEDPTNDHFSAYSGVRTLTSEVADNKPNLTKNIKGENNVAADAIVGKSLPDLASMTGRKGVSSSDLQSGITKPSLLPKN